MIEPQLPSEHAQNQLVAECPILSAQLALQRGEQNRRVTFLFLNPSQNLKRLAARRRDGPGAASTLGFLVYTGRLHVLLYRLYRLETQPDFEAAGHLRKRIVKARVNRPSLLRHACLSRAI